MGKQIILEKESKVSPKQEKERLNKWPRIGICLEKVMTAVGHMEDVARLLREDEGYTDMYTIEEQIQRVSDSLRASIREFEKTHKVKIEIFTPYSPFEDYTDHFIRTIKKPDELL